MVLRVTFTAAPLLKISCVARPVAAVSVPAVRFRLVLAAAVVSCTEAVPPIVIVAPPVRFTVRVESSSGELFPAGICPLPVPSHASVEALLPTKSPVVRVIVPLATPATPIVNTCPLIPRLPEVSTRLPCSARAFAKFSVSVSRKFSVRLPRWGAPPATCSTLAPTLEVAPLPMVRLDVPMPSNEPPARV